MESFSGIVIGGKKRGKELGFPTANIKIDETIPEGIYVAQVNFDNRNYNALVFIGSPRTFDEDDFKAEVYILDFEDEIYGKFLNVKLLEKIRDNMKFENTEKLLGRMKKDREIAIKYFENV